jgi:hypothetical protein
MRPEVGLPGSSCQVLLFQHVMSFAIIDLMCYGHECACCKGAYTPIYVSRFVSLHAAALVMRCKQPLRIAHLPAATTKGRATQYYTKYQRSYANLLVLMVGSGHLGTHAAVLCGRCCCRRQQVQHPAQHKQLQSSHSQHYCCEAAAFSPSPKQACTAAAPAT